MNGLQQLSPSRVVPTPPHRWVPHGLEKTVDRRLLREGPDIAHGSMAQAGKWGSYLTSKTIEKKVLSGSTWGCEKHPGSHRKIFFNPK